MFHKKLDPLSFHHISALTATNCMKITKVQRRCCLLLIWNKCLWFISYSLLITL